MRLTLRRRLVMALVLLAAPVLIAFGFVDASRASGHCEIPQLSTESASEDQDLSLLQSYADVCAAAEEYRLTLIDTTFSAPIEGETSGSGKTPVEKENDRLKSLEIDWQDMFQDSSKPPRPGKVRKFCGRLLKVPGKLARTPELAPHIAAMQAACRNI